MFRSQLPEWVSAPVQVLSDGNGVDGGEEASEGDFGASDWLQENPPGSTEDILWSDGSVGGVSLEGCQVAGLGFIHSLL